MRTYKIAVILLAALVLFGCAKAPDQGYQDISAKDLYSILQNEKGYKLIDVREPSELEETGFIPGAVNIPLGQLEKRAGEIPRDKKVIIYCRTGRRSAEGAKILAGKGYTRVYNLEKGIVGWTYNREK